MPQDLTQPQFEPVLFEDDPSLPWPIRKEIAKLIKTREKILEYTEACRVGMEAKEKFEIIQSVSIGHEALMVQGVLLHCYVDSIKEIRPLLTWLAQRGYRQTTKPSDYEELNRRTWHCGHIQVLTFFQGQTCRYVEVGKKEVPILELRCED